MTRWIVRTVLPWALVWAVFAYVAILLIELVVFGRLEWVEPLPGAIGVGIGLAAAQRLVPFQFRSTESDS